MPNELRFRMCCNSGYRKNGRPPTNLGIGFDEELQLTWKVVQYGASSKRNRKIRFCKLRIRNIHQAWTIESCLTMLYCQTVLPTIQPCQLLLLSVLYWPRISPGPVAKWDMVPSAPNYSSISITQTYLKFRERR